MTYRVRPKGSTRRSDGSVRRKVAGRASAPLTTLDDRPLRLSSSRDGKRLLVTLPYEVWIIGAKTLEVERSIALESERPSVYEGDEGVLWLGGQHLHRGGIFGTSATKVGSKLGGFVDYVCPIRPRLLCCVGTQGEVLWDLEKEEVVHRRKVSEHPVLGLMPSPDGRAVWIGGEAHAWVIDPDHPSGYTKLKLKSTSAVEVEGEAIVGLGPTRDGGCVLVARDGAVGWTNRALRMIEERFPRVEGGSPPLAVACDAQWVYVLRAAGVLHRFLLAQPKLPPEAQSRGRSRGKSHAKPKPEPEPLPEAEYCRLRRLATCLVITDDGQLVLAGPHADDQLGRLWREDPAALAWESLPLGRRTLVEATESAPEATHRAPNFVATRTKVSGAPMATLGVDDVLAATPTLWLIRSSGTLLERPTTRAAADEILPGDTVLLPAMVRAHEGRARPALLLWPGVADAKREPLAIEWLVWGDRPRGWTRLRTPEIRAQGWSRRDVFPLQIALPRPPPAIAGRRAQLSDRWVDAELFSALGRECKKLLKVIW